MHFAAIVPKISTKSEILFSQTKIVLIDTLTLTHNGTITTCLYADIVHDSASILKALDQSS